MAFSLILLTACSKPTDPQTGLGSYINTFIYNQEVEQQPDAFFSDLLITTDQAENLQIASSITNSLDLDESHNDLLTTLENTINTNLNQKTDYAVTIDEESKNKATATIEIHGLADLDEKKFDALIEKNIKEVEEELTETTTKEEVQKISSDISLKSLNEWLSSQEKAKTPTTVKVVLIVNPDDKEKWLIQEESTFYQELFKAFNY